MLYHLKHLGVFGQIGGLILGEFTMLEREVEKVEADGFFLDLFKEYEFPIIKTNELGHGRDKKMIIIGKRFKG
jgi:muramoyltetrapeptide carboxypeptidase LdcA involved in peptidoglycan recycling